MDYLNGLEKLTKKLNQRAPVNIIDMLFEFRVWANYAGSDTILQLKGGVYTKFLEKNLSTISFFMAGICEMVAIAFLGEKKYAKIFEEFYLGFIKGRDDLYKEWYNISIINRYRIYKSMGMVNVDIKNFTAPNIDPLKIVGK
jgi:hypothetical protein